MDKGTIQAPIIVPKGGLVADAAYFNQVPRAPRWYTPAHIPTTVCLQQVTLADLMLHDELENNWLPNTCNETKTRRKGAQKVSEHDHGHLIDEISRMKILEFDENEDSIMDCSGSEGEQSMVDDSSDSESSE
jgi:hypothetical protein